MYALFFPTMPRATSLKRRFVTQMFLTPSVVTLTIAATRIHRSLTEFAATAGNNVNLYDTIQFRSFLLHAHGGRRCCSSPHVFNSGHASSVSNRPRALQVPLSHMGVTVHKAYEIDQMNHHVSFIDTEGQLRNNVVIPECDVEVENSAEIRSQDLTDMSKTV
jgi:hypothetical protein